MTSINVTASIYLMRDKECCRLYGISVVHDLTIALADDPHTTGYVLKPLEELGVVRLQAIVVAERWR